MQKNVASQKLIVFAFDSTTNLPKSADAANITAYVSIDFGSVTVLGDTSATEMDATNAKGYYLFDLTQAETNGNTLLFSAKSSTANIVVIGVPATVFTDPANYPTMSIDGSGRVDIGKILGTASQGAAGYMGLDWGHINAPTTTQVLSGTTIGTATVAGSVTLAASQPAVTFASYTITGKFTISDGLDISRSTNNQHGVVITGSGVGNGIQATGGATGNGIRADGGATNGHGMLLNSPNADGLGCIGQAVGSRGAHFLGGDSGYGLFCSGGTNSGGALFQGDTTGHGATFQGGSSSGDGLKAVAGGSGVDIRGSITGDLNGDVTALSSTTKNAIADSLLDRADAIEVGITPRLGLRYSAAAAAGKLSGAATATAVIKGANTNTTRITATVDADGNRTAITLS